MNRLSILAFLLLSVRCFAATGDTTAMAVRPDGWSIRWTIEGKSTGGTYNFGLGPDGDPATGSPKAIFTVVRPSFTDTGTPTTITDTVYGTYQVRQPYPSQALNDETINGGGVSVRFSLSDQIFAGDTITAVIGSGLYTQSGANNSWTGAVTNESVASYADVPVFGAWNVVPFQRVTGNFKLRASAWQILGRNFRPARLVKFTVTDGTTTLTENITTMTVSNDDGDAVPINEYIPTINVASFAQGATLTCNFQAYPWAGDASAIMDTSTGTAAPTPLHGPITMILDKTGTYGVTKVLVDAASGNDATGQAYDTAAFSEGSAAKYRTIAAAAKGIKDYNTARTPSRPDVGAGEIYLAGGNHVWMGASLGAVYGSTPATWITIKSFASPDDVFLTSASGNTDISDRIKFEGITVTSPDSFTGIGATWWKGCVIDAANTSLFRPGVHWLTQCDVVRLTQGLKSFSTENCAFAMVRGCDLTGFAGQVHFYNCIGNLKTGVVAGNPRFISSINGSNAPAPQSQILAYNRIYGFDAGVSGANLMLTAGKNPAAYEQQRGLAIVQNIFERIGTSKAGTVLDINTGSSDDYDNVILWNNTLMGERQNIAYNSTGSLAKYRRYWSVKNNFWWDHNIKDDTFTGESGADGNRIGNWSVEWGVGWSGNVMGEEANDKPNVFPGLRSKTLVWVDDVAGNAQAAFQFVDYRANDGQVAGTGNGDYTPLATSPAYNLQYTPLIPYDILGNPRSTTDSAGAISTAGSAPPPNTAPVVTITSPATGSTTSSPATIAGTATDAEDGTISSTIAWSSSIDGALGTGASISPALSAGVHTITASITDAGSATDTDTITLTITAPASSGSATSTSATAASIIIQ